MRGVLTIRRIGGSVAAAAALAAVVAAPAAAMVGPACSTRVAAPATTIASCSFDSNTDWATIAVATTGPVTVGLRCVTSFGYTYATSRTLSDAKSWASYAPGYCTLTLTSGPDLTVANASATPTLGPIIGPDPA